MSDAFAALKECAGQRPPEFAIILGSGLGGIAGRVQLLHNLPFAKIPGLAAATVDGHDGRLLLGDWAGQRVLIYSGRIHAYEAHSRAQITAPIRLANDLGAQRLLLTNAAGGIRADLTPGTLMAISAILDMTRPEFWRQSINLATGCSERLLRVARQAAAGGDVEIMEGVYAAVLGPNYETPAEIRGLRSLGIDAVGMSTAAELEAAAGLGMEPLAISCITNRAAGLSDTRLTHEEVLATSQRQARRMGDLLEAVIRSEPSA